MNAKPPITSNRGLRIAQASVASAFLAVAITLLVARPVHDAVPAVDARSNGFLHTPAADLSVPSAEEVFASQARSESDSSPTF